MKKTFLSLAVMLGLGASFTSCSDENQAAPGNDGNVTFNVAVPGSVLSRADFGDGTTAQNNVAYYVYDQADAATPVLTGTVPMSNLKGTLTLSLANSHTYDVVFLATAVTSPYTYDATSRQMSVEYGDVATSDENLDAFYAVVADLKVSGPAAQDVKLYRPFAQLNIGTSDKTEYEASTGTTLSTTSVSVTGVYSAFDLMAGDVTGPTTDVTFKAAALPEGQTFPVSVEGKTFTYLSMDYLLVNQVKDIVEVALDVTNSAGTVEHKEYSNIPVQRNYRTNIYGALLTDEQMFNVEIVPGFGDPDYDISIEPSEPVKDASGVYLVKTQGELAWLAQQVNDGNMMSNATFSLQNDIYMQGKWTPIGGGGLDFGKRFSGTFLGNGYTIYDMVVDVNERAGFFGFLNGKVEDLNFDNASVTSNHWAGVVAGYSDNETGTCWIKNCKVANSAVTLAAEQVGGDWDNGDKGGAIIGFMANRDQVENCQVTNCTIQGYRDLGGVIGYSAGSVIRNNVVDGVTIYVDNSHNYKNYTTLGQGGNDAQAVIGENAGGTDEGNSSSNVTIVGLVADGVTMDADGNYVINAPAGLVWMASQVNDGVNNFRGKMVKLGADLDMAGVAYEPCGNVLGYPTTTFCGSFDGCNHTIANLTASSIGEEGYAAAGLFGSSVGPIKNVTLTNVNIRSTHYAGAICGFSSTNVGFVIENCHVDGGTVVSAAELIGGDWDNGDKVGGIIGYTVIGDQILDCSVKNITVQGYRDLGGLVGYSGGATITGNSVENVKVLVDNSHNYKNYTTIGKGGNDAGEIIGEIASAGHDSNNSATGVSIASVATSQDGLNAAVASVAAGENTIFLAAGTYAMPSITNADAVINIYGVSKDAVIKTGTQRNAVKQLNFNNVTIQGGANYTGFQHVGETTSFTDCVLENMLYGYSPTLVFDNCVFMAQKDYSVYTYASTRADFTGCSFSNSSQAKAILVYSENGDYAGIDVNVDNCRFSAPASSSSNKGVVEIHTELFTGNPKGTVNINSSTYSGPFVGWVNELDNTTGVATNYWSVIIND